LTDLIE